MNNKEKKVQPTSKCGNSTKPNVSYRFPIDFFEFSFLVEACIPPRPIARACFWQDVIDKHYHSLTVNERLSLFGWINRNNQFENSLANKNEDCLLFNARFDKENQYKVKTFYLTVTKITDCFKWQGKYHLSKSKSVNEEYIVEVVKCVDNGS